ncbi:transposase (fragment) [Hyella patelloides LEGE 07179]|uniref:Transposase n=1 Tax=Hyella patelloides LEGE 07179 TaxID=945734 RepID=A0A563VU15_9CYAN
MPDALLVWNYLNKLSDFTKSTVYQPKQNSRSSHLTKELKQSSLLMK